MDRLDACAAPQDALSRARQGFPSRAPAIVSRQNSLLWHGVRSYDEKHDFAPSEAIISLPACLKTTLILHSRRGSSRCRSWWGGRFCGCRCCGCKWRRSVKMADLKRLWKNLKFSKYFAVHHAINGVQVFLKLNLRIQIISPYNCVLLPQETMT